MFAQCLAHDVSLVKNKSHFSPFVIRYRILLEQNFKEARQDEALRQVRTNEETVNSLEEGNENGG